MTPARKSNRLVWIATLFLVAIGLAAVAHRSYLLLSPPTAPRFPAAAGTDAGFNTHRAFTFWHIIPGAILFLLMPLQFVERIRTRHAAWHRWAGRAVLVLGFVAGITALKLSYTSAIGGANETAATTLFAILFLFFLAMGYRDIRRSRVARHREWMIRAFGVALGIATTRPIIGTFFATRKLTPHEFFGTAFWLGFTTTLIAAEAWIHWSGSTGPVAASHNRLV